MVAVQLWRDCEEIPHVQGKRSPSKTVGAGVATAWRRSDFGEIPHVQGERRNTSKMVGGAKSHLESNPIVARMLRGLKQTLCIPGPRDPTETESELCLSISCGGTGQQWVATGAGALGAADLGWVQQTWVWHKPSWRRSPLTLP